MFPRAISSQIHSLGSVALTNATTKDLRDGFKAELGELQTTLLSAIEQETFSLPQIVHDFAKEIFSPDSTKFEHLDPEERSEKRIQAMSVMQLCEDLLVADPAKTEIKLSEVFSYINDWITPQIENEKSKQLTLYPENLSPSKDALNALLEFTKDSLVEYFRSGNAGFSKGLTKCQQMEEKFIEIFLTDPPASIDSEITTLIHKHLRGIRDYEITPISIDEFRDYENRYEITRMMKKLSRPKL